MQVTVRCTNPDCPETMTVSDNMVGRRLECPGCGTMVLVEKQEGTAPVPPPPAAPDASAPASSAAPAGAPPAAGGLSRETIRALIQAALIVVGCAVLQAIIWAVAGPDRVAAWINLVVEVAVVVVLVRVYPALRRVVDLIVARMFRPGGSLAGRPEMRGRVTNAALCLVALLYLGIVYNGAGSWLLFASGWSFGLWKLVRICFLIASVAALGLLVWNLWPFFARMTDAAADHAAAWSQAPAEKACPACGAKVDAASKFCGSCGKDV